MEFHDKYSWVFMYPYLFMKTIIINVIVSLGTLLPLGNIRDKIVMNNLIESKRYSNIPDGGHMAISMFWNRFKFFLKM